MSVVNVDVRGCCLVEGETLAEKLRKLVADRDSGAEVLRLELD